MVEPKNRRPKVAPAWMADYNFEEKRERRAFQEQGALGLILELEKRVNMNVGNEDVKDKIGGEAAGVGNNSGAEIS
ncbi:hypothetical protein Lal_00042599 [Lupinus albus]|nr:hypothetical protein Lal_00042599 [Lupinus albus]